MQIRYGWKTESVLSERTFALFWSALTSAFMLFLLVNALNCRHLFGPRHPIHINIIGPQLQRHFMRGAHPRYAPFVSACFFWDDDDHRQPYG